MGFIGGESMSGIAIASGIGLQTLISQPSDIDGLQLWLDATDIGVQGYSLDFDGIDDYVQANNIITAYPFTLECWVKLDVTNATQRILGISETSTTDKRFGIFYSGSTLNFNIIAVNGASSSATSNNFTPSANTWYHVAGVFESTTNRKIYINGIDYATSTGSVNFNNSVNNKIEMARHSDNNSSPLNGKLSDVRVWNTARTAQQIADNYNKRLIGNESGLVGYWKLDEGNATTAKDYTSNANAGTISGAIWDTGEPFSNEAISDYTGVRTWKDKSGNSRNATQSLSSSRPTYRTNQINGKPAITFDGVNDRFSLSGTSNQIFKNVSGATIFSIVKYSGLTQNENVFSATTNTGIARVQLRQTTTSKFSVAGRRLDADSLQSISSSTSTSNNFVIHTARIDYQNTLLQQYINTAKDGEKTDFQTSGNTSDTTSLTSNIGSISTSEYLNGSVAEIIVFNRALTNGELTSIHNYLKNKWDL